MPGCLRRQPGGEGAGRSRCSSRSSSLCPWSPQVSALLSRATTDRCVPCAGWGRPDKRCAPASGEYACLSLSSCDSSDCVCILLALSCVLARRVPGTSRGLISGTSQIPVSDCISSPPASFRREASNHPGRAAAFLCLAGELYVFAYLSVNICTIPAALSPCAATFQDRQRSLGDGVHPP